MQELNVGFIQFNPLFGKKEENLERIAHFIDSKPNADLLVLPELPITGYLFLNSKEVNELAEPIPGKIFLQLLEISKQNDTYLISGFCEKKGDHYFNSAVVIGPEEGLLGIYRKIHLFFEEKHFFEPGNKLPDSYEIRGAQVATIICFDWIFPEITRILALKGIDILCHPSNLVLSFAQTVMRARAIENRIFTITANRVGCEKRNDTKLAFTGQSQIIKPNMEILAKANETEEIITVCEINPVEARNKNVTDLNHIFKNRREDLYSLLEKNSTNK
ncbi:MAG: nitrilase-related carbon-nitrogen hydrolase [Promethearchaeota archaeon]